MTSSKRWTPLGYALLFITLIFGLASCVGASIEYEALKNDEYLILYFKGPVSYRYQTLGGGPISYEVQGEKRLEIVNENTTNTPGEFNDRPMFYARLSPANEVKFYWGPDCELLTPTGDLLISPSTCSAFRTKAVLKNTAQSEDDQIDANVPITFTGDFVGAATVRREYFCAHPGSNDMDMEKGYGPRPGCLPGLRRNTQNYTLQNYNVMDLKNLWLTEGHNSVISGEKGQTVNLILKNIEEKTPVRTTAGLVYYGGMAPVSEGESVLAGAPEAPAEEPEATEADNNPTPTVALDDFKIELTPPAGEPTGASAQTVSNGAGGCSLNEAGTGFDPLWLLLFLGVAAGPLLAKRRQVFEE